jgi:hypothetical protein
MKRIRLSPKARLVRDAIRALRDLELAYTVEFYRLKDDAAKLAQAYALDCSTTAMCLGSSYASCVAWVHVTLSASLGVLHPNFANDGRVFCPQAKKIVDKLRVDFVALDAFNSVSA